MSSYKIYHNPRCSKSRQVLEALKEKNAEVEVVEYLKSIPTKEELTNIIEMLGISPESLLRKGEAIFKEEFKGRSLSDNEWIEAMVKYPKLIERPIVIKHNKAVVARPLERIEEL